MELVSLPSILLFAYHCCPCSQRRHDIRGFLLSLLPSAFIRRAQGNLIYLALITERVPIIGPFTPSHIGGDAGDILFSEVFDIDYLSEKIGIPVLEWNEVKNLSTPEVEDIGCWSVWEAVQARESGPRITNALPLHGLGEQTHVCVKFGKLIYHRKIYPLLLAPPRFKSFLGMSMIHMPTSGVLPRCSIQLAERRTQ